MEAAVREALGVGSDEPPGWTWKKTRRIREEYRLLDRMPDLSHWFDVVLTEEGRRYVPTKETKRLLD